MLCYFKLILGDILLYALIRLLLKAYTTYKADYFYYTQVHLCIVTRLFLELYPGLSVSKTERQGFHTNSTCLRTTYLTQFLLLL